MTVLWILLFVVFIFSFLSRSLATFSTNNISYQVSIPNRLFMYIVVVCFILVSGLRNTIGDTYSYMHAYSINDFTLDYVLSNKDPGFSILQMVLKSFSGDPQLMLFVTALITNLLVILTLYKYSRMIELSVYVFITSGLFIVSMNGIRQFFAAAIVFCATKYLLNGDFKRYALIVILASAFHQSALILIPIYFIVRREAWTKITFLILTLAVFIVLGFNQFSEMLYSSLENTQYSHYSDFAEGGANKIRVLVESVPVLIAFFGREKMRKLWPKSDIIVNLSVINLIFMIIATQNWIFARFNIYFSLYNLILISWMIYLFRPNDRKFVYYGLLVCYFVYFFYEQVITLNIVYDSDYIKF